MGKVYLIISSTLHMGKNMRLRNLYQHEYLLLMRKTPDYKK